MDLEEYQVRELERHNFVWGWITKARKDISNVENNSFILSLSGILIRYLKEKKEGIEKFEVPEEGPAAFFFIEFFSDVFRFSNNIVESNAIVAKFLSGIIGFGLSSFHHELSKGEIVDSHYKYFG